MKVKINNIDEFCKALKEGYILRDEETDIEFKDNIINLSTEGVGSLYFKVTNFSYYKPDQLKIECGKFYKTRDGRKVCICFYINNSYVGAVENDGFARRWLPNGKGYHSSGFDLVSEWKEDK